MMYLLHFYLALWLLNGLIVWAGQEDENSYVRRILAAKRLSTPPTIDGDISDAVWQEATVGEGFTDDRTNQLVTDQI